MNSQKPVIESPDDIVISGVGGYFPKATNLEVFKKLLLDNETLLENRWKAGERGVSNVIGKIPTIQYFDAAYFGIHRQQSTFMDPMQRLVLERTYEALTDAGVNPVDVRGKRIGVFLGSSIGENDNLFYESIVSGFGVTGHSRSMMPNRVSYWLNTKGPSCSYDHSWNNGAEMMNMALNAIREGYCESAIIGTANLALNSELSWLYDDMGLVSEDGVTRSFDANANGYARSDGVVVLYIQRKCVAKRVYATIVNAKCTFDGNRDGKLMDLNPDNMHKFFSSFFQESDVDPNEVEYVETYGCGLPKIDEIELNVLEKFYCKNRPNPLLIGSVKPNAGHSEASAVLFNVAKVIIAMESGLIPATINYSTPNPKIKGLLKGNLEVVTTNRKYNGGLVAINGISLVSDYSHILLRPNSLEKKYEVDDLPRLVVASTRTEEGIKEIVTTVQNQPKLDPEYICLIQDLFSKTIPGHLYRGYTICTKEKPDEIKSGFEYYPGKKRQIWFVFSGMGSQWCGMANALMELPIFAQTIRKCHDVLVPKGIDLMHIITTSDKSIFDNILHSFVGIAAIQIALTDLLTTLGIVPDGIIGHSVGELGCAYADGCMTAEQMMLAAYSRGLASLEADLIQGMMAAIGLGYQQIKDKCPPSIEVACHNGPDSSTISGPTEDMEQFVATLQKKGVFARLVNVSNIAYHSRYIKPAAPTLLKYLKEVIPEPKARSSKWISTSIPETQWDTSLAETSSAEYHTNNLLSSVLFEEGSRHIPQNSVVIEIAPHGLLQAILKRSLAKGCTNIPLTQRGNKDGLQFFLSAIGKLFINGVDVNLPALYSKIEYPVSRGTPSLTPLIHWEHSESWRTGLEEKQNYLVSVKDIQVTFNSEEFRDFVGHHLDNRITLPPSAYLMMVVKLLGLSNTKEVTNVVFEDVKFRNVITVPKIGFVSLSVMIQKGSGEFEVTIDSELYVSGRAVIPFANEKFMKEVADIEIVDENIELTESDIYNEFHHRGHKYAGLYKAIKKLNITEKGSKATIHWNKNWCILLDVLTQLQVLHAGERSQNILIPKEIQRIALALPELSSEQEITASYNFSTGQIWSKGIQISGVTLTQLPLEAKPLSMDTTQFVPYNNPPCISIEYGINVALQIILENFEGISTSNITVAEILGSSNNSLIENIKNVMNKYTSLNANITQVKNAKYINVSQVDPLYIITNNVLTEDVTSLLNTSHGFALALTSICPASIVEVAQFYVGNISYSLYKQASKLKPVIIHVKSDTLSVKDLTKPSLTWVSELKSAVSDQMNNVRAYLVSNVMPLEGISNFVQELKSIPEFNLVRTAFLLDKKASQFTPDLACYKSIFSSDLHVNVVKDGKFGSFIPVPVELIDNEVINTTSFSENIDANLNIDYIGFNVKDDTLNVTDRAGIKLGNIDYSGTGTNGQRLMGLARLDVEENKIIPDTTLTWNVPKSWSMEDAVTVPHAYSIGYYALVVKARLRPGETVLIHGGCTAIGLACISIASTMGCPVYVSVSTDWQRAFLKKRFTFVLRDRNILSLEDVSFEPNLLMATDGVGAHVVLNCLSQHLLDASLRCVADFGRIVHIGKYDLKENNSIGMSLFMRNTSFYGLNPANIFNASAEIKKAIQQLVESGLEKTVVRPLDRKLHNTDSIETILTTLNRSSNIGKIVMKLSESLTLNELNISCKTRFICDPKGSYLIYGGNAETWTDMAEWLILRGARKIVVSSEYKPQQTYIKRRLTMLQHYYNADIIVASNKAHTRESTMEMLSEVYYIGPIKAVFTLPSKNGGNKVSDIKSIMNIDSALRTTAPKAILANFLSYASGICQNRGDLGYPTYNISWPTTLDFNDVLGILDDIVTRKAKNIIVKDDKLEESQQENKQATFKKLNHMLPLSLQEFKTQALSAPGSLEFVQLPTKCPRHVREVPPVFILPGLSARTNITYLASQLMYPVYYANYPSASISIEEMAKTLYTKIKAIQTDGHYNLVGISWGGSVAIEIAKLLEKEGNPTQLYFLDGSPETIQLALKHLDEGSKCDVNLLTRILHINNAEVVKKLNTLTSWEERLKCALENIECNTPNERGVLYEALTTLKNRLEALRTYKPSGNLVAGNINLLRPSGCSKYDNCGLLKFCKQTAKIDLVTGDHLTMLRDKNTFEIINERLCV